MSAPLPPVEPLVLAEAVDGLPARLRKKVDDAVIRAADWLATVDGDQVTVRVDDSTTVTLDVSGGSVRSASAVRCNCLLAPNCLHRAAVLARAPIASDDAPPTENVAPDDPVPDGPAPDVPSLADEPSPAGDGPQGTTDGAQPAPLGPAQLAAAENLWRAGVAVLEAGIAGSGVVLRTSLLRATHEARANGLHHGAALGRRVASGLRSARDGDADFRLAELTDDMRDLLGLTHRLRSPGTPPSAVAELLGTARRAYDTQGGLRLYGLCTVPVLAESGYAGATTYLVDRNCQLWTVSDIAPGDVQRAVSTGDAAVRLGQGALSHRALGRTGLLVSGATASATGQLGAGRTVRAVRADGAQWTDGPIARLWAAPLAEQLRRAFAALRLPVQDRPAGADLLFVPVLVLGAHRDGALALVEDTTDGGGIVLTLAVADDHSALAYRDNLRLLGTAAGLRLLLVGRPDPARRATVYALSVGFAGPTDSAGLALPETWAGRVDLGYDRLHRSHLPADGGQVAAGPLALDAAPTTGDPSMQLLRRHVERVVSGGRAAQALAPADDRRLRHARLETGARLLAALTSAARTRPRDAFGRLADDDGDAFATSWLAASVYEDAASRALAEASWLSAT